MKVGIIGSGTMGVGIAQAFAQAGDNFEVVFCGVRNSLESPTRGRDKIKASLDKRVAKGKMEAEAAEKIVARIIPSLREDLKDCDLIIEAGKEEMGLKKEVFQDLDSFCKEDAIFATNTSSLSVTEIANGLNHKFVGLHFFNPVPVMKLVEIIPGFNTDQEVVDKMVELSKEIGKEPVVVKEYAGFVVNRILIPMINEAVGLFAEGISTAEGIDTAMKFGANHPMGPLELGDLIGLDVCLAIMETLFDETKDSKYRPHPLLVKMVRGNHLGRKTGVGFYQY